MRFELGSDTATTIYGQKRDIYPLNGAVPKTHTHSLDLLIILKEFLPAAAANRKHASPKVENGNENVYLYIFLWLVCAIETKRERWLDRWAVSRAVLPNAMHACALCESCIVHCVMLRHAWACNPSMAHRKQTATQPFLTHTMHTAAQPSASASFSKRNNTKRATISKTSRPNLNQWSRHMSARARTRLECSVV